MADVKVSALPAVTATTADKIIIHDVDGGPIEGLETVGDLLALLGSMSGFTEALADKLVAWDTSASALGTLTLQQLFDQIPLLATITPHATDDYVAINEASASSVTGKASPFTLFNALSALGSTTPLGTDKLTFHDVSLGYARTATIQDVVDAAVTPISIARLTYTTAYDTAAGASTSGSDVTVILDTEDADPDSIVTLSSNQFTLGAGTYLLHWGASSYKSDAFQTWLYDVTGTANLDFGSTVYNEAAGKVNVASLGWALITPAASNTYEIRSRFESTDANGLGRKADLVSGYDNVYNWLTIWKLA